MSFSLLRKFAYIYLILPLLIFSLGWLNHLASAICVIALCISYLFSRSPQINSADTILPKKTLIITFLVALLWCFLAGLGGHFFQTPDLLYRNTIYKDMIYKSWPVYYIEGKTALNYYFGFWLVPTFLTKSFLWLENKELIFTIGCYIQLLWAALGVAIFLNLLISYIQPQSPKHFAILLIVPILFSGLDIIPSLFFKTPFDHLEVWNGVLGIQYSSMTTQLFWVFNQAIPTWIATMLYLKEKTPNNYGILLTATLISAALPAFGLSCFMLAATIKYWYNAPKDKKTYQHIFSVSNFYIIPLFIAIVLFLNNNIIANEHHFRWTNMSLKTYLIFYIVEFMVYLVAIAHLFKKELNFVIMTISLTSFVFLNIGSIYNDFVMRASIPALIILMTYVIQYLYSKFSNKKIKAWLYFVLLIGAATSACEFYRNIHFFYITKQIIYHNDYITLDYRYVEDPWRLYMMYCKKDSFFVKYLMKKYHK